MNIIDSLLQGARNFFSSKNSRTQQPTVVNRPTIDFTPVKRGVQDFVNYQAKQPVMPVLGKFSPTTGQALDFARSVTVQPIARAMGEGITNLIGLKKPLEAKDTEHPELSKFLFGNEPLRNYSDPERTANKIGKFTGHPEVAAPLIAVGAVTDLLPLEGIGKNIAKGVGKEVLKEGGEQVVKDVGEQAVKSGVLSKMRYLFTFKNDLMHSGYSEKEAEAIGYQGYKQMVENGHNTIRGTKEMIDEAQSILDPKKVTEPIGKIVQDVSDVKNRVNIFDYLRTPNRVLHKIGFGNEARQLRQAYDKYAVELPQEIDKITQWAKRADSPASTVPIFQWLDGDKVSLSPNDLQIAKEIKTYLKGWATKLNLPEDSQITNYISHIFPKDQARELDPAVAALIRSDKVAGSVYDPFLQKRVGKPDYIRDTWRALDAYVKRAVRKYNMDPVLEKISQKAEGLDDASFNYLKGRIDRVNLRPTDLENMVDNAIKASPIGYKYGARPFTAVSSPARQMVFRGLLGLNPASALRNIQQSTNTYALLGERDFLGGVIKTVQNMPHYMSNAETELERVGVLDGDIITDRTLSATKKFWQNADKTIFYLFNQAEKVNRSIAYYGAKAKALRAGKTEQEAIEAGKALVRRTQFNYDVVDTPAILQNDIAKTFLQFGTYPLKQAEFLGEMVLKDKNIAGSVRWLAANTLFLATVGKVLGMEPKDLIPSYRFGIPPTLQAPVGVVEAFTNGKDQYGNDLSLQDRILNKDLVSGVTNYVPAGAQLRKVIQGTQAYLEGGSYTPSGKLRFPVDNLMPAVFGMSAAERAKDYYKNGSPLGDKQTQMYRTLIASGMSKDEAYQTVTQDRGDNFSERIKQESEPQSLTDHIGNFFSGLFGKKNDAGKTVVKESDDPLTRAFQNEIDGDEKAAKIKEVFKLGKDKATTEKILQQEGLGTYEEAQVTIMKALGVDNGNRGKYINEITKDMSDEDKWKTFEYLAENEVLTTGVIAKWVDDGQISDNQAEALRILIKMTKGTYKPKAGKKPPHVSVKGVNVSLPKLSVGDFKPVKLEFKPTQRPATQAVHKPASHALRYAPVNTNLQYDKPLERIGYGR